MKSEPTENYKASFYGIVMAVLLIVPIVAADLIAEGLSAYIFYFVAILILCFIRYKLR